MSYLDRPRLTFFGTFTANPSTINNSPYNYAQPLPYTTTPNEPGYVFWNPYGRHNFSLNDCPVTSVVGDDGKRAPAKGSVNSTTQGVLVDLDSEQQMVSQIIGMQLTVTVDGGSVAGTFAPVNFVDIFSRTNGNSAQGALNGDGKFCAAYQSVLTDLQWNEGSSRFLQALKAASATQLSIRFNVDAYHDGGMNVGTFTMGRVAGTIGPQGGDEPASFTNARFQRPVQGAASEWGNFNFAQAKLSGNTLTVDLGNAAPTLWNAGSEWPVTALDSVQVVTVSANGAQQVAGAVIGTFDTSDKAYQANAFVQDFEIPEALRATIAQTPTGILTPTDSNGPLLVMSENLSGGSVNADGWVLRMNPGDTADVTLWANTFQEPAANQTVVLYPSIAGLLGQAVPGIPVATPPGVLSFPVRVKTGPDGRATFTVAAGDPGNPRGAMDGQMYAVGWSWIADQNPDTNAAVNVHVFDSVPVPETPTWWQDVFPILVQYSYLYAAMQAIIALDDYDAVVAKITEIIYRLTLPETSPGYMPITRELSRDKLEILLKWANDPARPQGTEPVPPPVLPPPPPNTAPKG